MSDDRLAIYILVIAGFVAFFSVYLLPNLLMLLIK